MERMHIISLAIKASILSSVVFLLGCDPGYTSHYRLRNLTTSTIKYSLYWREHNLYNYTGALGIDEDQEILSESSIGVANNGFEFWAESLFVNDSVRIIPCDTAMFITNYESDVEGVYTLVLTDSLIQHHEALKEQFKDSIFDCFQGYWDE